jgi:uncharacterized membrane protein YeaQ/YmgE (transglycosylase-associated protein family)
MFKQLWNQSPLVTFQQYGWQMSLMAWLVLGLVAGFIASKIVNRHGEGVLVDIVLGIVGAIAGGFLFRMVGASGLTGFNLWSLLVATTGAIVLLVAYHAIRGRRWAHR